MFSRCVLACVCVGVRVPRTAAIRDNDDGLNRRDSTLQECGDDVELVEGLKITLSAPGSDFPKISGDYTVVNHGADYNAPGANSTHQSLFFVKDGDPGTIIKFAAMEAGASEQNGNQWKDGWWLSHFNGQQGMYYVEGGNEKKFPVKADWKLYDLAWFYDDKGKQVSCPVPAVTKTSKCTLPSKPLAPCAEKPECDEVEVVEGLQITLSAPGSDFPSIKGVYTVKDHGSEYNAPGMNSTHEQFFFEKDGDPGTIIKFAAMVEGTAEQNGNQWKDGWWLSHFNGQQGMYYVEGGSASKFPIKADWKLYDLSWFYDDKGFPVSCPVPSVVMTSAACKVHKKPYLAPCTPHPKSMEGKSVENKENQSDGLSVHVKAAVSAVDT